MIIQNYRIFASVIYEIIRINNTSLPKIIIIPTEELNSKKADAADTKHTTSSNNANVDSSEKVNPSNEKQRGRIGTLFLIKLKRNWIKQSYSLQFQYLKKIF